MTKTAVRVACLLCAALVLSGCADYLDRREAITFGAGNAQQANLITHAVDPVPARAADRHLVFHGERMANAVERYRTGDETEPEPSEAIAIGEAQE